MPKYNKDVHVHFILFSLLNSWKCTVTVCLKVLLSSNYICCYIKLPLDILFEPSRYLTFIVKVQKKKHVMKNPVLLCAHKGPDSSKPPRRLIGVRVVALLPTRINRRFRGFAFEVASFRISSEKRISQDLLSIRFMPYFIQNCILHWKEKALISLQLQSINIYSAGNQR